MEVFKAFFRFSMFIFENMKAPKNYPLPDDDSPISSVNEIDFSAIYSYRDYMRFTFDERLEIIKGHVFNMSPAPARLHQKISTNIFGPLYNALKNKKCEVYAAPFDVRLAKKGTADAEIFNVVQPDLVVICDLQKLDERGCIGAPDIVIEILSPGNNKKELGIKYEVYEEAGVKEYWIINPLNQTVTQHLNNGQYKFTSKNSYHLNQELNSTILPSFSLPLSEIFLN